MTESTATEEESTALPTTRRNVVAIGTLAVTPGVASGRSTTGAAPATADGIELAAEKEFRATAGVFRATGDVAGFQTPIGEDTPVPTLYVRYVAGEGAPRVFLSHSGDGGEHMDAGVDLPADDLRSVGEQLSTVAKADDPTTEWAVDGEAPRARIGTGFASAGIDGYDVDDATGELALYSVAGEPEAAALRIGVAREAAGQSIDATAFLAAPAAHRAGRYMVAVADDLEATGRER